MKEFNGRNVYHNVAGATIYFDNGWKITTDSNMEAFAFFCDTCLSHPPAGEWKDSRGQIGCTVQVDVALKSRNHEFEAATVLIQRMWKLTKRERPAAMPDRYWQAQRQSDLQRRRDACILWQQRRKWAARRIQRSWQISLASDAHRFEGPLGRMRHNSLRSWLRRREFRQMEDLHAAVVIQRTWRCHHSHRRRRRLHQDRMRWELSRRKLEESACAERRALGQRLRILVYCGVAQRIALESSAHRALVSLLCRGCFAAAGTTRLDVIRGRDNESLLAHVAPASAETDADSGRSSTSRSEAASSRGLARCGAYLARSGSLSSHSSLSSVTASTPMSELNDDISLVDSDEDIEDIQRNLENPTASWRTVIEAKCCDVPAPPPARAEPICHARRRAPKRALRPLGHHCELPRLQPRPPDILNIGRLGQLSAVGPQVRSELHRLDRNAARLQFSPRLPPLYPASVVASGLAKAPQAPEVPLPPRYLMARTGFHAARNARLAY